ncbi:MAG: DNA topoisomerase IB [Pyrinomonadaceae bacterium]
MTAKKPLFDKNKAREAIVRGRRARWWIRKGSKSRGFHYTDADGKRITDETHLDRTKALVIPPAWTHVRISPFPGSSIQAVGMDTTGRIQYLYNAKFAEKQQRKKFSKIIEFGKMLPRFRDRTNEDIARDGFPREKVLAVMMRLINSLYIRVGTEKSAKHYRTYGITTLQNKHLCIGRRGELVFEFVGKHHIKHRKVLVDEDLAEVMAQLKSLGGAKKLFHFVDENGKPRPIKPGDVNDYIKSGTDKAFSSKDFRTWGGTLLGAVRLAEIGKTEDKREAKSNIVRAMKSVAEELGNTPAVCRGSYVHPAVISKYEAGITLDDFRTRKVRRRIKRIEDDHGPEEKALLRMLE